MRSSVACGVFLLSLSSTAACVGSDPIFSSGPDAAGLPVDAAPTTTSPPGDAAAPDSTPVGDATSPDGGAPDGADGAPPQRCDPTKDFGVPALMPNVNTAFDEASFTMTRDELTGFLHRENVGATSPNLLATRRSSASVPFPTPDESGLNGLNTVAAEYSPSTTADGLVLYFHRQGPAIIAVHHGTRTSPSDAFVAGGSVTVGGTALTDALSPRISADGQTLYWLDFTEFKLHSAPRRSTPGIFGPASDESTEPTYEPVLSANELTLYYTNGMADDVLVATRANKNARFQPGTVVASLSSAGKDAPVFLTSDGCEMVLKSTRAGGLGGFDLWVARRPK